MPKGFAVFDMDAIAARVRAQREPLGLNVRFVNLSGEPDSFSFATPARAQAFRDKLRAAGRELLD